MRIGVHFLSLLLPLPLRLIYRLSVSLDDTSYLLSVSFTVCQCNDEPRHIISLSYLQSASITPISMTKQTHAKQTRNVNRQEYKTNRSYIYILTIIIIESSSKINSSSKRWMTCSTVVAFPVTTLQTTTHPTSVVLPKIITCTNTLTHYCDNDDTSKVLDAP